MRRQTGKKRPPWHPRAKLIQKPGLKLGPRLQSAPARNQRIRIEGINHLFEAQPVRLAAENLFPCARLRTSFAVRRTAKVAPQRRRIPAIQVNHRGLIGIAVHLSRERCGDSLDNAAGADWQHGEELSVRPPLAVRWLTARFEKESFNQSGIQRVKQGTVLEQPAFRPSLRIAGNFPPGKQDIGTGHLQSRDAKRCCDVTEQ